MINFRKDILTKIAFNIYDFDGSHSICSLDMYTFLKIYEFDEDCFLKAFSSDLTKLESVIN